MAFKMNSPFYRQDQSSGAIGWNHSLGVRLGARAFLIAGLVATLGAFVILQYTYQREIVSVEESVTVITRLHMPGLAAAVWNFADHVDRDVEAAGRVPHAVRVELLTEHAHIVKGTSPRGQPIVRTIPVRHFNGRSLGTLTVTFDMASIWSTVLHQAAPLVVMLLAVLVITAVVIILMFQKHVTRHLHRLSAYLRGRNTTNLDEPFAFVRPRKSAGVDELDFLLQGIDAMRANLKEQLQKRHAAETTLEHRERDYREIFRSTGDAIIIYDPATGRIVDVNPRAETLYGYRLHAFLCLEKEEIDADILPGVQEIVSAPDQSDEEKMEAVRLFECQAKRSDMQLVWVEMSLRITSIGGAGRVLAVIRDITERKLLTEQLQQSEKLKAIGQLAGGIAHDFNNQLSSIMGYAELLLRKIKDETFKQYVSNINIAAKRSAELTAKLLAFGRKGKNISEPVDIHEILDEVIALLERSLEKRITISQDLHPAPLITQGDPTQLQSAILNLALNAKDAMQNGGTLTFKTDTVNWETTDCQNSAFDVVPGRYLCLCVVDTGCGMDESTQARIFEPFFTTKKEGEGTGMGLASVYGTVCNHKGAISVSSKPEEGTTFQLFLPLAAVTKPKQVQPYSNRLPIKGNAHILIVDDDPIVLELETDLLRDLGYTVSPHSNGKSAIEQFKQEWKTIDLVLIDMLMPDLNGRETFAQLRSINPDIIAILVSGFSGDGDVQSILDDGVRAFIRKPFHLHEISMKVGEVLK